MTDGPSKPAPLWRAYPDRFLPPPPDVHVPEDLALAQNLLLLLYEKDADDAISTGFDKFAAVLGAGSDDMGACYMAEINFGMDGLARDPQRIKDAIGFFRARLDGSRYQLPLRRTPTLS